MQHEEKMVFVGLSGGVDSSVAALRLKNAGYTVVGVFIRVWHPDFIICTEEQDRIDAMRVAAHLSIPFLTCDARDEYKALVADEMIREYERGRTPNPDVLCNKAIKFGVFEDFRKKYGIHYMATGHYAKVVTKSDTTTLHAAPDAAKDQSYFLSMIDKKLLSHILFPIGNTLKGDVRKEAQKTRLPSAERRDSQGICFLGKLDMKDYLSHFIESEKGTVVDTHGSIIGTHDGVLFYTIGQRHGFSIISKRSNSTPLYVVAKDVTKNQLTVDTTPPLLTIGSRFSLSSPNLLIPEWVDGIYDIVTRYHGPKTKAFVTFDGTNAHIVTEGTSDCASLGQTCVIYDNDKVLLGGIIESSL